VRTEVGDLNINHDIERDAATFRAGPSIFAGQFRSKIEKVAVLTANLKVHLAGRPTEHFA
jgi:hypothetical protein